MRIITFLSALLFSCVVVFVAAYGWWFYQVESLKKNLPVWLALDLPGELRYQTIVPVLDLDNLLISLQVRDASIVWLEPETGASAQWQIGDMVADVDLFSPRKMVLKFPQQMTITTQYGGANHRYDITAGGFTIELGMVEDVEPLFVSSSVLRVVTAGRELISTGYLYAKKESGPTRWQISVNNSRFTDQFVDNISLQWQLGSGFRAAQLSELLAVSPAPRSWVPLLASFGETAITDGRFTSGQRWYAFSGPLQIDAAGRVQAELFLSTNQFDQVMGWSRDIVGALPVSLERMLYRMARETGGRVNSLRLAVRRGQLFINGSPAGEMPRVGQFSQFLK